MYYLATDIFSIVFAFPHPFPNLSLLEVGNLKKTWIWFNYLDSRGNIFFGFISNL